MRSKFHQLYGILMSLPRKNLSQNFSAQVHGVVLAFCVLSASIFRREEVCSTKSRLPADGTPCLLLALLGILIDGGESVGVLLFLEFGFSATAWFRKESLRHGLLHSSLFHVSRHCLS